MKHNILKYTGSVVQHVRLLECNKLSNETEYFQICSQNILETSEFLTKIRYKMELTFDTRKNSRCFGIFNRKKYFCMHKYSREYYFYVEQQCSFLLQFNISNLYRINCK